MEINEAFFAGSKYEFARHLAIEQNQRIIFSGRFGIGKTTFLKDYFFKRQYASDGIEQYNTVHIFPVNYSIAQNEDILRYIKYDILLDMLSSGLNPESIDLEFAQTLPFFVKENSLEVLANLLAMIPMVGKDMKDMFKDLKGLFEKFSNYHKEKRTQGSNERMLIEFMENLELQTGSIYEHDVITAIIEQELAKWRISSRHNYVRENILIIDDLDRIDPEHIFRILNVFAAHFDRPNRSTNGTKFDFDKIVLVCDINNIRQIFRSKYGQNADFSGYIDKFYSNHIFEFNPFPEFLTVVKHLTANIPINSVQNGDGRLNQFVNDKYLKIIFEWLIVNQELDLRNILKLKNSVFTPKRFYIGQTDIKDVYEQLVWMLIFLSHLKGDYMSLIETFSKTHEWPIKSSKSILDELSTVLVTLLSFADSNYDQTSNVYVYRLNSEMYYLRKTDSYPYRSLKQLVNGSEVPIFQSGKFLKHVLIDTVYLLRREAIL